MLPWPVLACNGVSHATLIGTKILLSDSATNASFGVAINASVEIIHAGGVMLLIAENVMNSYLCDRRGCIECMEVRPCTVCNVGACSRCYDTEGYGMCEFCSDAFCEHHGHHCDVCDMMTCKYCKDRGAMCSGHR